MCGDLGIFSLRKDARIFIDAMDELNFYATPIGVFSPSANKETHLLTSMELH